MRSWIALYVDDRSTVKSSTSELPEFTLHADDRSTVKSSASEPPEFTLQVEDRSTAKSSASKPKLTLHVEGRSTGKPLAQYHASYRAGMNMGLPTTFQLYGMMHRLFTTLLDIYMGVLSSTRGRSRFDPAEF